MSRAKKSKNKKCNRDHNGGNRFPVKVIEGNNLCVKEQSCSDCEKQKPNHPSYNLQRRERLQLLTNVLMLIVATLALLIYKEQLETTQTDERAWLRVDLVNQTKKTNSAVVVDPSKPLSAHITVTNIGKTAAKAIYIDACMEILDRAQPAHIEWMSRCYTRAHYREETGMLFPSGNISDAYMQKVDQNLIPSSPTPDQSKRFAAGQDYVVVFGRAHYIDVFRQERWTQFCFPVTRRNLSEAARQCVNFATEGQGDYDRNYAKVQ